MGKERCDWVRMRHCNNMSVTRLFFFFPTLNKIWTKKGTTSDNFFLVFLSFLHLFVTKKNPTWTVLLCILSVSLFLFFINQEDMICYVTACTMQHTENKTTTKKKRKQYKWNCTKQHRAINNPYNNNIFHIFEVFPLPNPGDPPSVRSQLLLEGDWASFILRLFIFLSLTH